MIGTVRGAGYTLGMSALAMGRLAIGRDVVADMTKAWAQGMCERLAIDVRTHGVDEVAWDRPYVLVANHQSYLDIMALYRALPRPFGMVAKRELFAVPFFSGVMRSLGCVSIDRSRGTSAKKSLAQAAKQVREGASIVVFPEGTRSLGDRIQPMKKGPFHLIDAARAPVLPIGITGTAKLMSRDGVGIRSGTIEVRVGKPFEMEGESGSASRKRLAERVRAALCELTGLPAVPALEQRAPPNQLRVAAGGAK